MRPTRRLAVGLLAGVLAVSLVEVEPASADPAGFIMSDSSVTKPGDADGTLTLNMTANGTEAPDNWPADTPVPRRDPVAVTPTGQVGVYAFSFPVNPVTEMTEGQHRLPTEPNNKMVDITRSAIVNGATVSGTYDACAKVANVSVTGAYTARATGAIKLLIIDLASVTEDFPGLPVNMSLSTANPGGKVDTATDFTATGTATLGGPPIAAVSQPWPWLLFNSTDLRNFLGNLLATEVGRTSAAATIHFSVGWASQMSCPPVTAAAGATAVAGVRCRRIRRKGRTRVVCKRVARRRARRRSRRRR